MKTEIILPDFPLNEDRNRIFQSQMDHYKTTGIFSGAEVVAVILRDIDKGETVGGLWGCASYDWLLVEMLFVPEFLRRRKIGTQLIAAAEKRAIARSCVGIWLDAHDAGVLRFYKALGFEEFGTLPDYPRGLKRSFMRKLLSLRLTSGLRAGLP